MYKRISLPVEVSFTLFMLAIMAAFSTLYGLPISVPSGERASFVGIHYLFPLLGVGVWCLLAALGQKKRVANIFFIAFPCYAIVLFVHFNIKLWTPHINPLLYDDLYWKTDELLRPLVDFCFSVREWFSFIVPDGSNFYMTGFISMFYISFCYHALRTPDQFRYLFLSALIFQGLGALSYLAFPALGPFLFENGTDSQSSGAQQSMLRAYHESMAGGTNWLIEHGGTHITAGLGAMPSLHAGGSFLFFLFAWKHGRILIPLYTFCLFFILSAAVATRWHYFIDLPVGMALAWLSLKFGEWATHLSPGPARALPAVRVLSAH